jgi:hypothetical protein
VKISTRIKKLLAVLDRLNRDEIVQNRQLQALLSDDGYARYLDDSRAQKELRKTLQNKPAEVQEYEKTPEKSDVCLQQG